MKINIRFIILVLAQTFFITISAQRFGVKADLSEVVKAANSLNDEILNAWVKWYCGLYKIEI